MGQQYPEQPVPAVAAVVVRDSAEGAQEVLVVRRAYPPSQGEWSLPGGVLELGETLAAGVAREVLEETGIEVEPFVVLEVLDHIIREDGADGAEDGTEGGLSETAGLPHRVRFHYVLVEFLCRPTGGTLLASSDALEARWAQRKDVEQDGLSQQTLRVIEKGFEAFLRAR